MSRPRLLILSFSPIADDARVLKQVRRFADTYDVTTCGYGSRPDDRVRHIGLPDDVSFGSRTRRDLILRRYRHMYWSNNAIRTAREMLSSEEKFDLVLANDIEAVGLALDLRPRAGVHADIHEYAPRQAEEDRIWRWFVAPYVRWMCRRFLPRAASMTTVGAGIAQEYRRRFGVHADVVTNAAPFAELVPTAVGTPIRLVHSGAALRNRRIDATMAAVAQSHADVTLDLYLMPNDLAYLTELRALAATSERLRVMEPVPYAQLIRTLHDYDLGIHVIPPLNFNNRWALPNKFFDYIQARLGLIIGPSPEMVMRLDEYELGAAATGFEVADIQSLLDGLSQKDVERWKDNAHASAHAMSSEAQVAVWAAALDRLLAGPTADA